MMVAVTCKHKGISRMTIASGDKVQVTVVTSPSTRSVRLLHLHQSAASWNPKDPAACQCLFPVVSEHC